MALTGELTDLSLAELIEFFCNQRKTGRLTVSYPHAPAYFYLQSGSVVHASVGALHGIEAVYYALTQSNASFNFSTAYEAPAQTINQPWTSVVLEGLRRMDEGIKPRNPFADKVEPVEQPRKVIASPPSVTAPQVDVTHQIQPETATRQPVDEASLPAQEVIDKPSTIEKKETSQPVKPVESAKPKKEAQVDESRPAPHRPVVVPLSDGFLAATQTASRSSSAPWKVAAVFAALVLIVAAVAVPWYARGRAARAASQPSPPANEAAAQTVSQPALANDAAASQSPEETSASPASSDAADAARREREARAREEARLKAKASETNSTTTPAAQTQAPASASSAQTPAGNGSKKVAVQVTYDENGRVTQATGNDPTALRIARQKRFPPGKAGSATITIPIN